MTRHTALAAVCLSLSPSAPSRGGQIDQRLRDVLATKAPGEMVSTLVYLADQVDVAGIDRELDDRHASRAERHEAVVTALQKTAAVAQSDLLGHLQALRSQGRVASFQPFWIVNAVQVTAPRLELEALAARGDVGRIVDNVRIGLEAPLEEAPQPDGGVAGTQLANLVAIHAPDVWAMGYTGQGVLVATLDTGVDANHPALASRWRGLDPAYAGRPDWAWFDPVTYTATPQYFSSSVSPEHGTHTMGTICGGSPGAEVGVAPGAQWITAAAIGRTFDGAQQNAADAMLAFQWLIDPDGNPSTVFDVPQVCSNSWSESTVEGVPPCDDTLWSFLDAAEAAGILVVFSAGGQGNSGVDRPGDRASDEFRTLAVGAVSTSSPGFPVPAFSSKGPTFCTPDGSAAIKPDIAAPGVNVWSSVPNLGYAYFTGTSMACPHIAGVAALVLNANPDLSVKQVKQIIFDTALDVGVAGNDNASGWGVVDALAAVQAALATPALTFAYPAGRPEFFGPTGATIAVTVSGELAAPAPGTGQFHYSTDGVNFIDAAMSQGAPNAYQAAVPALPCGTHVSYYFSAATAGGATVVDPLAWPAQAYEADVWATAVVLDDHFETDQGWTTQVVGATSGLWQRGVPVNDPGWLYDPVADGDGSGQCWLTQNAAGASDVGNGLVRLISPPLDLASGNVQIRYDYFFAMTGDNGIDHLLVEVSSNGTAGPWTGIVNYPVDGGLLWHTQTIGQAQLDAADVAETSDMRIRFTANDSNPQSIVEAGVDGVLIRSLICPPACPGDLDGDGDVGVTDLLGLLRAWGNPWGVIDFLDMLGNWGPCR